MHVTGKLAGMTAVITGASRGIGQDLAIRFAREGATVIAVARTLRAGSRLPGSLEETADRIRTNGDLVELIEADLSQSADRQRLVREAEQVTGRIDVLVNNAAVSWSLPMLEFPRRRLDIMWEVQVGAPVELAQLVVPGMLEAGRGWVLNVSSRASEHPVGPPDPDLPFTAGSTGYGMCKAALERFSTGLASELHGRGVAVNALSPSRVVATWGTEHHNLVPPGRPDLLEYPEEFAEAALALCTGDPVAMTGRVTQTDKLLAELGLTVLGLDLLPFHRPAPLSEREEEKV